MSNQSPIQNRTSNERTVAQLAHSRRLQRRRKRRMRSFRFLLILFMIAAFVTLSLTVFFRIETIEVNGNSQYKTEEIINASGIKAGYNLFRTNSSNAEKKIFDELLYIENVEVKKHLPGRIEIVVTEAIPAYAIATGGDMYFVVSIGGKILEEINSRQLPNSVYIVSGVDVTGYVPGESLKNQKNLNEDVSEEKIADTVALLLEISQALQEVGFTHITEVDITNPLSLRVQYDKRIDVALGTQTELVYKLEFAKAIIEQDIKDYESGEIDASYCHTTGNAIFSPYREEYIPSTESSDESADVESSDEGLDDIEN